MVPPSPFLKCDPALTPDGSVILSDPALIDEEFRKAWLPYFSHSVRGHACLSDFEGELEGWLPALGGDMLFDVVEEEIDCRKALMGGCRGISRPFLYRGTRVLLMLRALLMRMGVGRMACWTDNTDMPLCDCFPGNTLSQNGYVAWHGRFRS